ncbi:MAG: hypothetical protein KHW87_06655 [Clostridiales bacterium]|nr:hypothetical protein [Clostridiales bacterium]
MKNESRGKHKPNISFFALHRRTECKQMTSFALKGVLSFSILLLHA